MTGTLTAEREGGVIQHPLDQLFAELRALVKGSVPESARVGGEHASERVLRLLQIVETHYMVMVERNASLTTEALEAGMSAVRAMVAEMADEPEGSTP